MLRGEQRLRSGYSHPIGPNAPPSGLKLLFVESNKKSLWLEEREGLATQCAQPKIRLVAQSGAVVGTELGPSRAIVASSFRASALGQGTLLHAGQSVVRYGPQRQANHFFAPFYASFTMRAWGELVFSARLKWSRKCQFDLSFQPKFAFVILQNSLRLPFASS